MDFYSKNNFQWMFIVKSFSTHFMIKIICNVIFIIKMIFNAFLE